MSQEVKTQTIEPLTDLELQYLLKELDIDFDIEAKARDRVEHMVQYLLTSIAAIIGGVFFLLPSIGSSLPLVFLAVLLIYTFGIISFYRTCRLRNIITHTRLTRYLIRSTLYQGNITPALLLAETEESLTGFSHRFVRNLYGIVIVCSLCGAVLFVIAGLLMIQEQIIALKQVSVGYGMLAVIGFLLTFTLLFFILRNHQKIAMRLQETYLTRQNQPGSWEISDSDIALD
jgi:hypothetical protein